MFCECGCKLAQAFRSSRKTCNIISEKLHYLNAIKFKASNRFALCEVSNQELKNEFSYAIS